MLASITPLGERGRQARWWITVTAFALGAAFAGAATGALLGLLGSFPLSSLGAQARLAALILAAVIALAIDLFARRVPGPRRQVDERWRQEYRGWVYGIGYGVQLGVGVTTVVLSAATYVALLAAFLTASAAAGAVVLGLFGLIRGLQPLATWSVRRPEQLVHFHVRFDSWRAGARIAGCVLLAATIAVALAGAFG